MLPSGSEYLIIFGAALLLFGPSKLPALGKALGEGINNFRKGIGGKEDEKPQTAAEVKTATHSATNTTEQENTKTS